jgi:outer membrane protein OmpA-like peptidoglycan-associated protein
MALSEKRAKATRNYLINKGVDANRIQASGFGESQLLDNCKCKTCTETQHQKNRRSEFIVDSINGIKCAD